MEEEFSEITQEMKEKLARMVDIIREDGCPDDYGNECSEDCRECCANALLAIFKAETDTTLKERAEKYESKLIPKITHC